VFDILADPTTHPAIDGTGWVREALDREPVTAASQIFRVAMYHDKHPAKNYDMANKVVVCDRPHAIAWQPGRDAAGDGNLSFGGWIWRYDVRRAGSADADVTREQQIPAVARACHHPSDRSHARAQQPTVTLRTLVSHRV
jgi:hypothetical protein